jgi:hypothetical protein
MEYLVNDSKNPCCICMSTLYLSEGRPQRNRFKFTTKHCITNKMVEHIFYFCDVCHKKYKINTNTDPNRLVDQMHEVMKARIMMKNGVPGSEQFKDLEESFMRSVSKSNPQF